MSKQNRVELAWIALSGLLLLGAVILTSSIPDIDSTIKLVVFLVPYLLAGATVLYDAIHGIISKSFLDENFLMSIASIGAICIGEYVEAVLVMFLYRIGELLQKIAVGKSRKSIEELINICPDSANLERDGEILTVTPDEVCVGETVVVRAGDRIPLDGTIIEGSTELNTAALTGESLPREVSVGDAVLSGCINMSSTIRIRVEKEESESTATRVLELIEGAAANKSKSEDFITKFARWYTPSVVLAVFLLAIIPPIFFKQEWSVWIYRALTFLVISCPCALVISVPLTFFSGIGCCGKNGVLVKGSNYLEALSKCHTVVFDKTGTLTRGSFAIKKLLPKGVTEDELLRCAAECERFSTHPLALSIMEAYGDKALCEVTQSETLPGLGVSAVIGSDKLYCGNSKLMRKIGIEPDETDEYGTLIHVAKNDKYLGYIAISDEVKPDVKQTISILESEQHIHTVMLTGDRESIAAQTAQDVGISEFYAELLPEDKVLHMERILNDTDHSKQTVAFVGDGINDAPVLARADIGFAMGGLGSDAAVEAADIVIIDDAPKKIPIAIKIAEQTTKIARQNILTALIVKFAILMLAALGKTQMWVALIADVGVCLIAVLNSMRAMHIKQ